jgi:hypothetical protein
MAKWAHNDVLDAPANYLATHASRLVLCSAQPTNYEELLRYNMASCALDAPQFTIGDGDNGGRKLRIGISHGIRAVERGTVTHIALIDTVEERLLYVTSCDPMELTIGKRVAVPAWDIEFLDPV